MPRLWTDTLGLLGVIDWHDVRARQRTVRLLTTLFPPLWAVLFLFAQEPVLMVQIGGIGSGIFLLAVVVAVWHVRSNEVDRRFRAGRWATAALVLSSAAITVLGVYTVLEVFGIGFGG